MVSTWTDATSRVVGGAGGRWWLCLHDVEPPYRLHPITSLRLHSALATTGADERRKNVLLS